MKLRLNFYFIVLVTVAGLTLTFGPLDIYASSEKNHGDHFNDSSFSLPFGSAFADESHDGDGGDSDDDGDDMDIDELPFP